MKRLRYQVAVSLDGFIAGPDGEYHWIVSDSSIDFGALFKEFDTAVMGRKTYEVLTAQGGSGTLSGLDVVVFSRRVPPKTVKGIRITKDDAGGVVAALKKQPGRDIWLFGGGLLFRSLLDAGLVDTVEVALMPVLLGSGIPLLPPGALATLELFDRKSSPGERYRHALVSCQGEARAWRPHPIHQASQAKDQEQPKVSGAMRRHHRSV